MNVTRPSSVTSRVWGLAMSCSSAPKRSAWPRVSSLASGSASSAAQRRRLLLAPYSAAGFARRARSSRPAPPRVAVHVEVVKAALLDAASASSSGRTAAARPSASISPSPPSARSAPISRLSSANTRSGATPASRGAARAGGLAPCRVDREVRARRRAGQPHRPAADRRANAAPDTTRRRRAAQVGEAAERVDEVAAAERLGDRVDRQVAPGEIVLDRLALQRHQVDLPAAVAGDHAPGAERLRERERVPARAAGDAARRSAAASPGDDDVEVGSRAAAAADRAPRRRRASRRPERRRAPRSGGRRSRVTGVPSRWYGAGTRPEIPQTIS